MLGGPASGPLGQEERALPRFSKAWLCPARWASQQAEGPSAQVGAPRAAAAGLREAARPALPGRQGLRLPTAPGGCALIEDVCLMEETPVSCVIRKQASSGLKWGQEA